MTTAFIGVLVAIFTSLFTALLTFFITTISYKNRFESLKKELTIEVKEAISTHNAIKHQDSMYTFVETELKKHTDNCNGTTRMDKLEKALIYIIVQMGGNPKDAGL